MKEAIRRLQKDGEYRFEEMTLLAYLYDQMDEGDKAMFTLSEAEAMVADQRTYEREHGQPEGEYDPHFWYDAIMGFIEQNSEEEEDG